jgi:hypothetical protein
MTDLERFNLYIECLKDGPPYNAAKAVWKKALAQTPNLRPPIAGEDGDGEYYFSWSYVEPAGVTLSITFLPTGEMGWYFRDRANDIAVGYPDGPVKELPGEVFVYLRIFVRPSEEQGL